MYFLYIQLSTVADWPILLMVMWTSLVPVSTLEQPTAAKMALF